MQFHTAPAVCNHNGTWLGRKSPAVPAPWHIMNYKLGNAFYLGVLVCWGFLGGWVGLLRGGVLATLARVLSQNRIHPEGQLV